MGKIWYLGNVQVKSGLVVIFFMQMAKIRKLGIFTTTESQSPGRLRKLFYFGIFAPFGEACGFWPSFLFMLGCFSCSFMPHSALTQNGKAHGQ